jgi:hypothetical protein
MILVKILLLAQIVFGCDMTISGDGPYHSVHTPDEGAYRPGSFTINLVGSDCAPNTPDRMEIVAWANFTHIWYLPFSFSKTLTLGDGNSDPDYNTKGLWIFTAREDTHPFASNEVYVNYITPKPTAKAYGCYFDQDRNSNFMRIGVTIDDPRSHKTKKLERYFTAVNSGWDYDVAARSFDGPEIFGDIKIEPGVENNIVLTATANDDPANVSNRFIESDPVSLSFTAPSVCPPMPEFKVLYREKEYLFDDCAPYGVADSCKGLKDEFQAGEFLLGDTVKLVADETDLPPNTTIKWRVDNLTDLSAPPIERTGNNAEVKLDGTAETDFRIVLEVLSPVKSLVSVPGVKKLKARVQITPDYLSEPFAMGNYQKKFGNHPSQDKLISGYGCYLVSTTTLFKESMPIIPSGIIPGLPPDKIYSTEPLLMDKLYVAESAYGGTNDLDLDSAARVQNKYGGRYDLDYSQKEVTEWNKNILEEKARKRTMAMLEVHSVNQDNLPLNKSWKLVPACQNNSDIKKLAEKEGDAKATRVCHIGRKHVIILKGIHHADGVQIFDPTRSGRVAPLKSGYSGSPVTNLAWRNTRAFIARPKLPLIARSEFTITFPDPTVEFNSVFRNGKRFNEVMIDDFSVSDAEGNGPNIGGKIMKITGANPGETFSVSAKSFAGNLSVANILARDTSGQVLMEKIVGIQFSAQGTATINTQLPLAAPVSAALQVNTVRNLNTGNGRAAYEVEGIFSYLGQPDFLSDGLNISIGNVGFDIPGTSLERVGNVIYLKSDAVIPFLGNLKIVDNGDFVVQVRALDLSSIPKGGIVVIRVTTGNQALIGKINASALRGKSLISEVFDKRAYSAEERAKAKIYLTTPQTKDVSFYLQVKVDGQEILAQKTSDNRWEFVTPRLLAGSHEIAMQAFSQDPVLEARIQVASASYRRKILEIEDRIADTKSEDDLQILESEKQEWTERLNDLEVTLRKSRRALGEPKIVSISYE